MPSFLDIFRKYMPTWSEIRNKPTTFDPGAHKTSHENDGADEINVAGLSGALADEQNAGAIAGVLVNDAGKGDQKVLAYDLGTERIIYITPAPSGAAIVSIQQGTTHLPSTSTSEETLLDTEVNLTNSVCIWLSTRSSETSPDDAFGRVKLNDSTHVIAERQTGGGLCWVSWMVIEFSTLTSVQQKILTIPNSGYIATEPFTTVDLSKAILFYGGVTSTDSRTTNFLTSWLATIEIASSTLASAERQVTATYALSIAFTIAEFP